MSSKPDEKCDLCGSKLTLMERDKNLSTCGSCALRIEEISKRIEEIRDLIEKKGKRNEWR